MPAWLTRRICSSQESPGGSSLNRSIALARAASGCWGQRSTSRCPAKAINTPFFLNIYCGHLLWPWSVPSLSWEIDRFSIDGNGSAKVCVFAPWLCSCAGRRSRPAADRRRTSHESQRLPPGGGPETTTLAAQLPRQARNKTEIDIETTRSFTKTGSGQQNNEKHIRSPHLIEKRQLLLGRKRPEPIHHAMIDEIRGGGFDEIF